MKDLVEEIQNMDDWNQLRIWAHYMVSTVCLNNRIHESKLGATEGTDYPVLGITTWTVEGSKSVGTHRIMPFEEFRSKLDDHRVSESILGWYSRFKNEINLKLD